MGMIYYLIILSLVLATYFLLRKDYKMKEKKCDDCIYFEYEDVCNACLFCDKYKSILDDNEDKDGL